MERTYHTDISRHGTWKWHWKATEHIHQSTTHLMPVGTGTALTEASARRAAKRAVKTRRKLLRQDPWETM